MVVGLGVLGIALYNSLFTAALALVEASRAALIVPTNPAFTALAAALLLGERFGALRAAGVALSGRGAVGAVAGRPLALGTRVGRGEWILILCIFMWSAYTRSAASRCRAVAARAHAYVMAAGCVPTAVPAWFEQQCLPPSPGRAGRARLLVVFGTVMPVPLVQRGREGARRGAPPRSSSTWCSRSRRRINFHFE